MGDTFIYANAVDRDLVPCYNTYIATKEQKMKILEIAEKLRALYDLQGNVEVFFEDPNTDQGPFSVLCVKGRVAKKDEFEADFDMPEGFNFVLLTN